MTEKDKFTTNGGRTGHYEELKPVYNDQQSYSGKAKVAVYDDNQEIVLKSFGVEVIGRIGDNWKMYSEKDFNLTNTTRKHIKDFVMQYGDNYARKELEQAGSVDKYIASLPERKVALAVDLTTNLVRELNGNDDPETIIDFANDVVEKTMDISRGTSILLRDTDEFSLSTTGRNYDFIAVIENKTDEPLVFSSDEELFSTFSIEPHDWVGLLADDDGLATMGAILADDYQLNDPEVMEEMVNNSQTTL